MPPLTCPLPVNSLVDTACYVVRSGLPSLKYPPAALNQEILRLEENWERKTMCGQLSPFRRPCPGLPISGSVQGLPFIQSWTLLCLFLPVSLGASPVCMALYSLSPVFSPSPGNSPALKLLCHAKRNCPNTPVARKLCFLHSDLEVVLAPVGHDLFNSLLAVFSCLHCDSNVL